MNKRNSGDRGIELQLEKGSSYIWIGYFHPHTDKKSTQLQKEIFDGLKPQKNTPKTYD